METFVYWQRRWYDRFDEAKYVEHPDIDPGLPVPGVGKLRSHAVREGDGGWLYIVIQIPGQPPGPLLSGCEYVTQEDAIAAIAV